MSAIGLVINSERRGAVRFAEDLADWLRSRGITVCATRSITEERTAEYDAAMQCLASDSDLVVVCGGDGSLLGTARAVAPAGAPILGVHWGGMGFLNECQPDQAREAIERFLRGDYEVEERLMLRASFCQDGEPCWTSLALNDVSVTRDAVSRILTLEVVIGEETAASYRGDGVLVATPTGSTAHSLSAGGPLMDPRVDALVLTPICPHSFNARAVVIPSSVRVQIRNHSPLASVIITVDGQIGRPMGAEDVLEVGRAPWPARFVRLGYNQFYHTLRDKLQWRL